jgi:hypothetical protein
MLWKKKWVYAAQHTSFHVLRKEQYGTRVRTVIAQEKEFRIESLQANNNNDNEIENESEVD